MVNLKSHTEEIDQEYSGYWFSQYMKGEWGITVGYKTYPEYYVNMRKQLCDWQQVTTEDCHNELFYASQGSVSYNCCPDGYTRTEIPGADRCCPPGYTFRNSDSLCASLSSTATTQPYNCPCCPAGYIYNQSIDACQGASVYDTVPAISCGYICTSPTGLTSPLVACTDLVPDSTLLSLPVPDECSNTCYQGVTWCRVEPNPVTVVRTTQGSDVSMHQFTVGATNGPVIGMSSFTPMISGYAYLIGKTSIEVKQRVVLTRDVDYSFNSTTGTITLLLGRVFNLGEVYSITAF